MFLEESHVLLFALFLYLGTGARSQGPPHAIQVLCHCYDLPTWVAHLVISEAIEKVLGPSLEGKRMV